MDAQKIRLTVKVNPGSRKSEVGALIADLFDHHVLQVYVRSIPEKGAANKELIEVLADYFDCPKSLIQVVSGGQSRLKIIQIEPAPPHVQQKIADLQKSPS